MTDRPRKVAIIHDWLVDVGGAEKTLQSIYKLYPVDTYVLFYQPGSPEKIGIDLKHIHASFLQMIPGIQRFYRNLPFLFPAAIASFDLKDYDVIISSSHTAAKAVRTRPGQLHICYCYSPMRWAWDFQDRYLKTAGFGGIKSWIARLILGPIRRWDYATRNRPTDYIGISRYIANRIKRVYGREAAVIYPPVDVVDFSLHREKEDYYLTASRMVPYKRIDLVVEAFTHLPDKQLVVIGDGTEFEKIKKIAEGHANITLLGYQPFNVLKDYMQRARAFIFAPEEDFGIVPLEAQATGTPVIAFGQGAARETIVEGSTGLFFDEQTVPSLIEAIERFERHPAWDPEVLRKNAERFSRAVFEKNFREFVEEKIAAQKRDQA